MNLDEMTIGQAKEIAKIFGNNENKESPKGLNCFIGKKVIVRTYSAGCWFGTLTEKSGNEVILKFARRLYRWWSAGDSISLSGVANNGVLTEKSKICEPVGKQWLEAIEIIPCTDSAIKSIEGAKHAKAE